MDEALEVGRARVSVLRSGGHVERHDVIVRHELGCQRAREEVAVRAIRVAYADVAEAVEHAEPGEDAVGRDEIVDDGGQSAHGENAFAGCNPATLTSSRRVRALALDGATPQGRGR